MKNISETVYLVMALLVMTPLLCSGCNCSAENCCEEEISVEMQCQPQNGNADCKAEKQKHKKHAEPCKTSESKECTAAGAKPGCNAEMNAGHHSRHMAETMLKAIKHKDYKILAEGMPAGCDIPVTAEEFQASSDMLAGQFGDLAEYTYLTELDTPMVCNQLWKTTFHKKDSEGKAVSQDLIFRFVTAERDGCNQIIGFGFM